MPWVDPERGGPPLGFGPLAVKARDTGDSSLEVVIADPAGHPIEHRAGTRRAAEIRQQTALVFTREANSRKFQLISSFCLPSLRYDGGMRSYDQYCSIAKALDVVGDRWTLLIIRELLLQGACRFTDLKNGLPGVAANLLSTRLRELEQVELISREDAPPPVATTLYRLTETGLALEPALKALGLWGLRYMTDMRPEDAFLAQWLAYAPAWFVADVDPEAPSAIIQLCSGGTHAVVEVGAGRVDSRIGEVADPDLVLDGPPPAVLGVLTGVIDIEQAMQLGLTTRGCRDVLTRLRPVGRETGHP
ncbi:winged helix-turn-helix transcriptional regulator [Nocardia sp. NPDC004278]